MAWKIGPALATGCTVILKPSEFTPLTALYMAKLVDEAGFPAGTFNLVNGYGATVGQAMADHHGIEKVRLNNPARIPALTKGHDVRSPSRAARSLAARSWRPRPSPT